MKKIVLILGLVFGLNIAVYAADMVYNRVFMMRTMKCLPTKSYVTSFVDEDGNNVTVSRKIYFWKDHKCGYSETTEKNGEAETYHCNLSRSQLTSFANAMRVDPENVGEAKDLWATLKEDQSTCTKTPQ